MPKFDVDPDQYPSLWIVLHPDGLLRDAVPVFRAEQARNGGQILHPKERDRLAISDLKRLTAEGR